MIPLRFAIDLDGVLADTHTEILKRYNRDWNDNLTVEDILYWDMAKISKPECGKQIYRYFEDVDLYDHILPMPHAKEAVDSLRQEGHTVVVATSCFLGTEVAKINWLLRHKMVDTHTDIIIAEKKFMINADVLIDDKPQHLELFNIEGGMTVAFDHPYNRHVETTHRIHSWKDDILNTLKAKVIRSI